MGFYEGGEGLDDLARTLVAGVAEAAEQAVVASLKKGYEPEGVDRLTERVVLMVESGQI